MGIDPNNARTPPRAIPPAKRPPTDKCPACLHSLARHTRRERLECEAWSALERERLLLEAEDGDR